MTEEELPAWSLPAEAVERIALPEVPQVWLKHARFDHGPHTARGIDCRDCHKDAYPSGEADLLEAYGLPRKGAELADHFSRRPANLVVPVLQLLYPFA